MTTIIQTENLCKKLGGAVLYSGVDAAFADNAVTRVSAASKTISNGFLCDIAMLSVPTWGKVLLRDTPVFQNTALPYEEQLLHLLAEKEYTRKREREKFQQRTLSLKIRCKDAKQQDEAVRKNRKKNGDQYRKAIAVVFETYNLYPQETVLENVVRFMCGAGFMERPNADKKAMHLLADFGIAELSGSYPAQLKREQILAVSVVRALMQDPEVIIFNGVACKTEHERGIVAKGAEAVKAVLFSGDSTGLTADHTVTIS